MMKLQEAVLTAHDLGIDVIFAKTPADAKRPGVHILEPTMEDIVAALAKAIVEKLPFVVIYSNLTWNYRNSSQAPILPTGITREVE